MKIIDRLRDLFLDRARAALCGDLVERLRDAEQRIADIESREGDAAVTVESTALPWGGAAWATVTRRDAQEHGLAAGVRVLREKGR